MEAAAPEAPGGTVLLCEDDAALREMVRRALHDAGFEVVEASNGLEALDWLGTCGQLPDILVTDVIMPRMGGIELAGEAGQRWPGVPILMISGYPGDPGRAEAITRSEAIFLEKPFDREQLLDAVRRARRLKRLQQAA
jgi:DNA-binding NtrC family response regulator